MKASKSAIFLFELMIIIMVFTLAAAVCVQIFARAFDLSIESRELTMSTINAQTIAEQFKNSADDADAIDPLYFDHDWAVSDEAGAYYAILLEEQNETAGIREAYVNVYKDVDREVIFTLHVKKFEG